MTRSIVLLCAALVLFAVTAFAADVTGNWTAQINGADGNSMTISYAFKQDGTKLTGTVTGPGGDLPIQDGSVQGDKVSFIVTFNGGNGEMKILNEGTVKGADEITLTVKVNGEPFGGPVAVKRAK